MHDPLLGQRIMHTDAAKGSVVPPRDNVRVIDRLTTRQLNRATLARQLLLERADCRAEQVLQHLVGMQSQAPLAPYVGLWTRVADFRADELSALMVERRAVRASLMRATIHLVTAADFLRLWPVLEPVSERGLWTGSPFGRRVPREVVDDLLTFVRDLLDEAPRTRAELRRLIGQRWPTLDSDAMAYAAQYLLPIVQVTPRGIWGQRKAPTWADAETWIGGRMSTGAAVDDLVLRYLGAFGPASVQDVQVWSGLTRLTEVADRLGAQVRRYRSEDGRVLLDVPDAPRPSADTPAPIRFLPEYDNLLLSHADRSRVVPEQRIVPLWPGNGGNRGTVLVDGFWRANWGIMPDGGRAHLDIEAFQPVPRRQAAALAAEGLRLLAFAAADSPAGDIRISVS
jgi:winged helix DNA-binding protein